MSSAMEFISGDRTFSLLLLIVVFSFLSVLHKRPWKPRGYKLPPGPVGIPILGNFFQLSRNSAWLDFEKWKNLYGSLVYISIAGQGMLIINDHATAVNLLDRRASVYGDRPPSIVAGEFFTGGLFLVFAKLNDHIWRRHRRVGHGAFHKSACEDYCYIQVREALALTETLLRNATNCQHEIRKSAVSSIVSIIYGKPPVRSYDDDLVMTINGFLDRLIDGMTPGNYLVEFFPWMKHIPSPFAAWKRRAQKSFEKYSQFFHSLFRDVEERIADHDESPCFASKLINDKQHHDLTDLEAYWLSAQMCAAGTETISLTMSWLLFAMVAYPDKQKKCQDELDAIVGRSRMPSFQDRESLPCLRATVREALRWRPAGPIGLQHSTTEDDFFEDFFIPKGTICIANIWSMNRDRSIYGPDADDFSPDRFIDEKGQLMPALPNSKDEGHASYGFGPRICLGRYLANNSIFMNIACLLWAANITAVRDEDNKPIIPSTQTCTSKGMMMGPPQFNCIITPRFLGAENIVAHSREMQA